MKVPLAAVAGVLCGLCAGPLEPRAAGPRQIVTHPLELNPHAVDQPPAPLGPPRERSASIFVGRLSKLDDRVTALKNRAERLAIRAGLEPDFDQLTKLRTAAADALRKLRDPSVELEEGEHAALTAINELEVAVESLAASVELLERAEVLPNT